MRIAIIGFGFSGLMAAANLVRATEDTHTLYIIDEKFDGLGVAYGTTNPDHLLNVRAGNMGAFPDDIGGFAAWLKTDTAKHAQATMGLTATYNESDFVPRMLYGAYLQTIWQETQEIAAQKKLEIKLVPSQAVAIQKNESPAVLTARGDAIAVDRIILAAGNDIKPVLTHFRSDAIIQDPWAANALKDAAGFKPPVVILGSGLTAVDIVLSLRRAGYGGEIILSSRRGLLPQMHVAPTGIFSFTEQEIAAQKNLQQLMRLLKKAVTKHGSWREVVDALRPHTQALWKHLDLREQQRFLARLLPFWNVHRHRMAEQIAERITDEMAAGTVRIVRSRDLRIRPDGETLSVIIHDETLHPSRVINCTGPELNLARGTNNLLRQLMAQRIVEPHGTGLGIAADPQLRAWGALHPHLYVIGGLLTGQLLESTAVPELRAQAALAARSIVG